MTSENALDNSLLSAAREVCNFLDDRGWEYCIIGGLAVQQWGEPRTTLDADITLLTDWGEEAQYVRVLLQHFQSRLPDAEQFALQNRVLLLRASNGKDVDVALGALPFEIEMVRRAAPASFAPGFSLLCCSAEDLFIMKMFAARPKDWADAETIVARQLELGKDYIMRHLSELCELKDAPEIVVQARNLLEKAR